MTGHIETLRELRDDYGASGWSAEKAALDAAIAALSRPAGGENAGPTWTRKRPQHSGVYGVRGFNLGESPQDQFEAIVAVRLHNDELVCNLHESTSEDDFDSWTLVSDCSDRFEWCEFTPTPTPPSGEDARDAERYRWLRDWSNHLLCVRRLDNEVSQLTQLSGRQLDENIDAAMDAAIAASREQGVGHD